MGLVQAHCVVTQHVRCYIYMDITYCTGSGKLCCSFNKLPVYIWHCHSKKNKNKNPTPKQRRDNAAADVRHREQDGDTLRTNWDKTKPKLEGVSRENHHVTHPKHPPPSPTYQSCYQLPVQSEVLSHQVCYMRQKCREIVRLLIISASVQRSGSANTWHLTLPVKTWSDSSAAFTPNGKRF